LRKFYLVSSETSPEPKRYQVRNQQNQGYGQQQVHQQCWDANSSGDANNRRDVSYTALSSKTSESADTSAAAKTCLIVNNQQTRASATAEEEAEATAAAAQPSQTARLQQLVRQQEQGCHTAGESPTGMATRYSRDNGICKDITKSRKPPTAGTPATAGKLRQRQ
jgi:hypothetical protein